MSGIREQKASLDPYEWDFRSVTEEELMTACLYEYTRSCPAIRVKFESWHAQPFDFEEFAALYSDNETAAPRERLRQLPNCTIADVIELVFDREIRKCEPTSADLLLTHLSTLLPFELSPNENCPVALRFSSFTRSWARMRADFGNPYLCARLLPPPQGNAPIFEPFGPPHIYKQLLKLEPTVRRQELFIDWSFTLDELTAAFHQWAADNRPDLPQGSRPKAGKQTAPERLKWLATYRLHQAGYSYIDATKVIAAHKQRQSSSGSDICSLPDYADKSAWSKAVRKAKELLASDFDSSTRALFRRTVSTLPR